MGEITIRQAHLKQLCSAEEAGGKQRSGIASIDRLNGKRT
jgi:hypothetical protein